MSTVEAAQALLDQIHTIVDASDVCEVKTYQVTAGAPADPSGQNCAQISVWASQIFNASTSLFHEDNPCMVVRGVQLNYRISVCYEETEAGRTPAQHLVTAVCLYDLADAVWCGLNAAFRDGFLDNRCKQITVDPLIVSEGLGGYVSADSGIRLQLDCPTPNEPEDIIGALAPIEEGQDFG